MPSIELKFSTLTSLFRSTQLYPGYRQSNLTTQQRISEMMKSNVETTGVCLRYQQDSPSSD